MKSLIDPLLHILLMFFFCQNKTRFKFIFCFFIHILMIKNNDNNNLHGEARWWEDDGMWLQQKILFWSDFKLKKYI